ncbi:MAG: anti-sigma factor family protein [Planctomycetaceae bacterium]
MSLDRDRLLDALLGEASPEAARECERLLASDPAAAAERDLYLRAIALVRQAAAEGWEAHAPRRPRRLLWAAAAALLLGLGALLLRDLSPAPAAIYEPDVAWGYLRGEETDARGGVPLPGTGEGYHLRRGTARGAPIGSSTSSPLAPGDAIAPETELDAGEEPLRIDLPGGAILFGSSDACLQLRHREDGRAAVRLLGGSAAIVAGRTPVHLAVEGTDLLLTLESGACLLRHGVPDAICLRGRLFLDTPAGQRFPVPEGHRIPAQCSSAPRSAAFADDEVELDWYHALVYRQCSVQCLEFTLRDEATLVTPALAPAPHSFLYLHVVPTASGTLTLRHGGVVRSFRLRKDEPFRLRLPATGAGPLELDLPGSPSGLKEARLVSFTPKD